MSTLISLAFPSRSNEFESSKSVRSDLLWSNTHGHDWKFSKKWNNDKREIFRWYETISQLNILWLRWDMTNQCCIAKCQTHQKLETSALIRFLHWKLDVQSNPCSVVSISPNQAFFRYPLSIGTPLSTSAHRRFAPFVPTLLRHCTQIKLRFV